MKRILSVAVVFFALVGSALASAPESTQSLLTLGNKQYVLKKSLESKGVLAAVIADPAIATNPAELFGLAESQVATYRAAAFGADADVAGLGIDLTAPLYIILGQDAATVWAMNVAVVKAAPELIYAVMKGQTSVVGAIHDAETGAVTILGSHPDLLVLASQHILGVPLTPSEAKPAKEEGKAEAIPAAEPKTEEAHLETPAAADAHAPAEAAHAPAEHATTGEGGGTGPLVIVLFIVALIGTVIFMDKTVLKS